MSHFNVTPTTCIAVVATTYIVYSSWRNAPDWIKDPFRSKTKDREKDANDDLANPAAIIAKLKELYSVVKSKTTEIRDEADLPWYKLHACFWSMFHLSAEIRKKHPKHRDDLYENCGPPVTREEAEYLRMMVDYAKWAYLDSYNELLLKLQGRGYKLLRHDLSTEPGRVGHYIALNYDERICILALKGTSTFSDVLTDCVGASLPHKLDSPFADDNKVDIICHEGIFTAASLLADDIQSFLENLIIPENYRIVLCGHSLGAGTACLLGLLLRSRIPSLRESKAASNSFADRRRLPLEVVAFATPAVLNYTACRACIPFTTCVVNNSDLVPRLSVSNLLTLNHALLEINRRLAERGLSPSSLRKAYHYAKDLCKLDEETLMTVEEMDALFQAIHSQDSLTDEHDLYVPGRVISLFERGEGREALEVQGLEAAVGGVVVNGSMQMLRRIELTTSMIKDHLCNSYMNNLDDLLRDM